MSEEVGKFSQGSLSSTIIQDLIMFCCILKFDIEEEDNIEEYDLIPDEKQLRDEIQEA